MKRKLCLALVLLLILANIVAMTSTVFAEEVATEGETITISYMNTQETTSDTTSLDTTAYSGGKQTVGKGEKFTLPTTSSSTYTGQDGYQLIWYTENGRTYKAGETVSFTEDTKLFRCVAKECYSLADVNYAMTNESTAAILMADISANSGISVKSEGQSVLILNGFTITITKNSNGFMGQQRAGKHVYGEGTINAINPDGKEGNYYFFEDKSHSHNGSANKTVIGVDVTINAPTMWLGGDGDGAYNNHYPWTRIYGKVNCYGLYNISNLGNRAPMVEVFEGANVTINGPTLFKDNVWRNNTNYTFNTQAFELRVYGGTFYLPAEAATEAFWTNDNIANYVDGTVNYYNYGLTKNTKDVIRIFGGSFVLPDNAVPAIADYLTNDWLGSIPSGGNGLVTNSNTSTYYVAYMQRPGYKLAFEKYTIAEGAYGKLTVTDYIDGSLSGTYYYQMTTGTIVFTDAYNSSEVTQNTISSLKAYEKLEDGTYVVTNKFELDFAMGGAVLFKNNITSADNKLQNLEANSTIFQVVVPADCAHNFTGEPLEATCEHGAYADYNCTKCGHNVYFSWGEKLEHNYVLGEQVQATLTALGSKEYTCSMCNKSVERVYSLDPTSLEVSVTIRNDDGTFEEITVLASDIFDFSTSGVNGDYIYTLSAIKAFGDYKIRNIYGVTIPQGILYMNITTQNYEKYNNVEYGVAILTFAEGSTIQVQNIGNLRRVEKIVVEKNVDVTFAPSCSYYSPNNERRDMQIINTIDLSAGNHTVTFMSNAFDSRGKIATLTFGENATYNFGHRAFNNCAILELNFLPSSEYNFTSTYAFYGNDMTELVLPDNFDMTFQNSTFENCPNLSSVTFGTGSTYVLGNYCFLYCPIEKVVLTAGSDYTIGQQAFINEHLTEYDMSAGNMNVTLNASAFTPWLSNKVYCAITAVKFGENSTYSFATNSLNDIYITEIILAPNSTYTFKKNCFSGGDNKKTFTTLDASADNITVVFEGEAFRDHSALTTLLINGKNSSYTFNGSSFCNTKVEEIVMGANSTYVFNGQCFNGSTPIAKIDASADGVNVTFGNEAFREKTLISTLLISGKNATYTFNNLSFYKVPFTELVLGEGSTYTFNSGCFNSANDIESFDASASNITATFGNDIFNGKSKLEYVNFGENSTYVFGYRAFYNTNPVNDVVFYSNSTYSFGQEVFVNADFNSIKFEDNVNVTFTGQKAFQYVTAVSLYLGKNFEIDNLPFCDMKYLEKIVIMDGVHFKDNQAEQWTFSSSGDADFSTPLVVYNHSYDMLFAQNMFNNCDGIVLYTVTDNIGTRSDVFSNCGDVKDSSGNLLYKAWTVYLGIPHPMVEGLISDPTCDEDGITGWVCDENYCNCDFKIIETKVVNKYENKHNITESTEVAGSTTYEITTAPAWGHDYGVENPVRIDWIYVDNNYFVNAKNKHTCTVCGEDYLGKDIENSALFTAKGVTLPEDVKDAIAHAITVNLSAVEAYNAFLGAENAIKYGVVAGIADGTGKPVTNDGKTTGKAVSASFENTGFSILQLKITNISNSAQGLYCCAYIIVDDVVTYLHNGSASDTATAVSLDKPNGIEEDVVENVQVEAVVETKEVIYA